MRRAAAFHQSRGEGAVAVHDSCRECLRLKMKGQEFERHGAGNGLYPQPTVNIKNADHLVVVWHSGSTVARRRGIPLTGLRYIRESAPVRNAAWPGSSTPRARTRSTFHARSRAFP